jgi:hypothetical protein
MQLHMVWKDTRAYWEMLCVGAPLGPHKPGQPEAATGCYD